MNNDLKQKDNLVNTDFWGAAIMFIFAAGYYSQLDPDFSHYARFFPNKLIVCLVVIGIALMIKGFVSPTRLPSFLSQVNGSMLFTIAVGLVWVFTLEWVGFIITSFLGIFALLLRFEPRRTPPNIVKAAVIAAGEVAFLYVLFVKFLQVTLPEGRLFY
ncbi:MAG: tripartite tricarboxylate transporter TctB family protein [Deltaproteobacteria bacterium]|nr:tripartite tricarboxylate transporter TctB family protein [Deltaproteobacteria bacterium]